MRKIEKICLLKAWFDDGYDWADMPDYMQKLLFSAYGNLYSYTEYFRRPPKIIKGIDVYYEDGYEFIELD